MKRLIYSLALTCLLFTGAAALAQEPGTVPEQSAPTQEGHAGHGGRHGGNPDERLAHMTQRYKLTADQQSQIKPILADGQQQMEALRSDTALSRQDKFAKFQSLHQEQAQKISAVLTDEQRKQFDADQQRQQERRAEHRHGGAGQGEGTTPPQPQ